MNIPDYRPIKKITEPFKSYYKRQKKSERRAYDKIITELSYQHETGVKTEIFVLEGNAKEFIRGKIIYMDDDIIAVEEHLYVDREISESMIIEIEIKNIAYVPVIRI